MAVSDVAGERAATVGMGSRTRLGLGLLASAVALGVLGDGLLRALPWGINAGLWVGTVALVVLGLARWDGTRLAAGVWLLAPAVLFALAVAWRASAALIACNLLAVLICLGLLATYGRHGSLWRSGFVDYLAGLVMAGVHAAGAVLLLVYSDVRWAEIPREGAARHLFAVGRGLLVALPLLLVFGGLFIAADAVFEGLVRDYLALDLPTLVGHLFVAAVVAWIVAGWLRQLFVSDPIARPAAARPSLLTLGRIEVGIILGLLDLLFLAFVLVQFRYLFGGAPVVEASATLTYAEYARLGFFELNAVVALLLPLLLVVDWAARKETAGERRLFRALAGLLVLLLFVVVASALQRMRLYTDEFGLTELRLYTTAFMLWITLTFGWFLVTVLPGRRERFMLGALVGGLVILAGLNALNPDGTIATVNAGRQQAPRLTARAFDSDYVLSLSADAVPTVVETLPLMPEEDRRRVASALLRRWSPPESRDWRSWHWSRERAWRTVEENGELLKALAGS